MRTVRQSLLYAPVHGPRRFLLCGSVIFIRPCPPLRSAGEWEGKSFKKAQFCYSWLELVLWPQHRHRRPGKVCPLRGGECGNGEGRPSPTGSSGVHCRQTPASGHIMGRPGELSLTAVGCLLTVRKLVRSSIYGTGPDI